MRLLEQCHRFRRDCERTGATEQATLDLDLRSPRRGHEGARTAGGIAISAADSDDRCVRGSAMPTRAAAAQGNRLRRDRKMRKSLLRSAVEREFAARRDRSDICEVERALATWLKVNADSILRSNRVAWVVGNWTSTRQHSKLTGKLTSFGLGVDDGERGCRRRRDDRERAAVLTAGRSLDLEIAADVGVGKAGTGDGVFGLPRRAERDRRRAGT